MNGFVLVLALVALAFAQNTAVRRFGLKGLRYTRRFSRRTAFEGEDAEMVEVIRNDRLLFIPWVRAESRLSPYLRFGRQENLSISGERYHKSIFTLAPFQQITRRHKVRLAHRGVYDAGNVTLSAGDLLTGGEGVAEMHSPAVITVYPKLLGENEIAVPFSRLQGEWVIRRRLIPDPFWINGIRAYQRGDSVRDIHWPASARMGEIQVKTHDDTADTRLLTVINVQMSEDQWGELMEYEQSLIEYAISLAATVSIKALASGIAAGFAANMPMGETDTPALLPPDAYQGREEELLAAFAALRIHRCRNFLSFLDDLTVFHGTDMLLISAYMSEAVEEKIKALRTLGNTVTVHLIEKEAERA
ncbi:MAG: DUF58 domain-containing protein [Clostridia bacterium]|nr:DUF58 domain-containing protein [Clostridia bacterium]